MDLENISTVEDLDSMHVTGQTVLLRASFDAFDDHGNIKDGLRIETTEDSIRMLKGKGASRIIILTYAGRPEKNPAKEPKIGDNSRYNGVLYDRRLSLRPTADFLHGMLKEKVNFISALNEHGEFFENSSAYINHARDCIENAKNCGIFVLDNLRFWEGENSGDKETGKEFAKQIASLGSVYVQDGFAQAHRINNATVGEITNHMKANVIGLQFKKEVQYLKGIFDSLVHQDREPFVFIVGGKKIETKPGIISKIDIASKLIDNMQSHDKIMVGGAMAYPFLIAQENLDVVREGKEKILDRIRGKQIKDIAGDSYIEWDQIHDQIMTAGNMLVKARDNGVEVKLPLDHGVFAIGAKVPEVFYVDNIAEGMVAGDIGPKTSGIWAKNLSHAHTVVMAGPVGWYENPIFAEGSRKIVDAIVHETQNNNTISIAAGGDTSEMVRSFDHGDKFSLVSIGGGATLEFLLHGSMPVLELMDKKENPRVVK